MSASDADRLARVCLAAIGEPGKPRLLDLVARLGAEAACDVLRDQPATARDLAGVDPERELEVAARLGLRFVVPGDEEWPVQVDDLANAGVVAPHGGVPIGLWVRGPLRLDSLAGSLAVVGSRSSTTAGEEVTRELAATVAHAGRVVVSGAAAGIDQAAHRGAIAVDGPTVAVLACGADRVYPDKHRELIDYIALTGAVVSETYPDGAPMRQRFLARNRLIAALTTGTVVVEAAYRSGALNTANWAGRLNRAVMGVPGPVSSASSAGVHELVRSGAATLVTSGADVLEVIGASGEHLTAVPRGPDRPRDGLTHRQQHVLDAVPVACAAPAVSIAHVVGIPTPDVQATLLTLELRGLVEGTFEGWRLTPLAQS